MATGDGSTAMSLVFVKNKEWFPQGLDGKQHAVSLAEKQMVEGANALHIIVQCVRGKRSAFKYGCLRKWI